MWTRLVRHLWLAAFVLVAGCGNLLGGGDLRVNAANPTPNVDLPATTSPQSLDLDATIIDSFVIPKTDSVNQVPVTGWRTTLTRAFQNGFKGGATGLVLQLRQADLSFAPAALGMGGTAAVRAHIRFKSSILDPGGKEVMRVSGEVDAHDAATSPTPDALTANASHAVEAMYEEIAAKVAQQAQPSAAAAP